MAECNSPTARYSQPYCQRQNYSPLNIFWRCIDYVGIAGLSFARGRQTIGWGGKTRYFRAECDNLENDR